LKQRFIELLCSTKRSGIERLIEYLETETDFFTAPASTRFHGAYPGGLLEHSLAVYDNLLKISFMYDLQYPADSMIISALLHDVCKANYYQQEYRNRKNPKTGLWEQVGVYVIKDQLPLGHGEKSVMITQQFIPLTIEEMLAIRWHMGGFDDSVGGMGGKTLSLAMSQWSLVVALHMADLAACYFDQK